MTFKDGHKFTFSQKKAFVRFRRNLFNELRDGLIEVRDHPETLKRTDINDRR